MSLLYDLKQKFRRKLPASIRPKVEEAIYMCLYRFSPARHANFFNSGYVPASPRFSAGSPFDSEPFQATLCDFVLFEMAEAFGGARGEILDIGCGLGGALRIAAGRYPSAAIVGVDASASAVKIGGRRLRDLSNVSVVQGNGRSLPFADGRFDFIFSIGAASYIGMQPFLMEAGRVLKPGGLLSFSVGYTNNNFKRQSEAVARYAAAAGLNVLKIVDITENVFAAIDADVPRRQALIDRVPRPLRGYALDWADMPGTFRYQQYADGKRIDYAVVCRKESA